MVYITVSAVSRVPVSKGGRPGWWWRRAAAQEEQHENSGRVR